MSVESLKGPIAIRDVCFKYLITFLKENIQVSFVSETSRANTDIKITQENTNSSSRDEEKMLQSHAQVPV